MALGFKFSKLAASRPTRRQGGPVSQAVGAPVPGFAAHMGAAAAAADQATWPPCMQLAAGAEAGRLHQRLGFPMMKVDSGPPRAGPQVASSRLGRGFLRVIAAHRVARPCQ